MRGRVRSSIKVSQPLHSQARLPLEEFKGESFHVTHCPEYALLAGHTVVLRKLRNATRVKGVRNLPEKRHGTGWRSAYVGPI